MNAKTDETRFRQRFCALECETTIRLQIDGSRCSRVRTLRVHLSVMMIVTTRLITSGSGFMSSSADYRTNANKFSIAAELNVSPVFGSSKLDRHFDCAA